MLQVSAKKLFYPIYKKLTLIAGCRLPHAEVLWGSELTDAASLLDFVGPYWLYICFSPGQLWEAGQALAAKTPDLRCLCLLRYFS